MNDVWQVHYSMERLNKFDELTPVRFLGKGSYGEVVRCLCDKTSREVAVKMTKSDRAYRLAAEKEIVALQLMQGSPHAVQYIRHYEYNGALYIVCELIPRTLHKQATLLHDAYRAFIKGNTKDTRWVEFIRRTIYACCAALAELHSKGFMHMDVKPDNVMVRGTSELGKPVLIDFGSVRRISENKYYNVQSLWYRAPEVALEYPYTPKADAWSVGCLLIELVFGQALFRVRNVCELVSKIKRMIGLPTTQSAYEEAKSWESVSRMQSIYVRSSTFRPLAEAAARRTSTLETTKPNQETLLANRFSMHFQEECEMKDLALRLLHPEPSQRLSCEEALNHPFLRDLAREDILYKEHIASSLTSLQTTPIMRPEASSLGTTMDDTIYSCAGNLEDSGERIPNFNTD